MKVKLDDVIVALEFVNAGIDSSAYYNDKMNEFIYISEYSDMADEKREDIYDNCIGLPTKYSINEYEMMEEFIETIGEVQTYNQLMFAINGKGAFRNFKNTCINYGIIDDWYKFRDCKYKEKAIEWCKQNKIEFE